MLSKNDLEHIRQLLLLQGEIITTELKKEIKEVKDDLTHFKAEMYSFRDDMYAFKDEMYSFQSETRQKFKDVQEDIAQFKDETLRQFKDIHDDISILAGHQDIWERHEYDIKRLKKKVFPELIHDKNR